MKVILIKDVKGLGKEGDMVNAKTGYARNYLLPNKFALPATKENVANWEEQNRIKRQQERENVQNAMQLKEQLENITLEIKAKTGQGDRLFGSITTIDIAEELEKQKNIAIDKKKIELKDNIKNLGTFTAIVKVYPDISANLSIHVDRL